MSPAVFGSGLGELLAATTAAAPLTLTLSLLLASLLILSVGLGPTTSG